MTTIVALSSGPPPAGVAVVRLSGPASAGVLARMGVALPTPRQATLRTLRDAAGEAIDRALVLWFPAPASFTGEDVAEFHVHGGPAVVEAVLAAACAVPGVALAEAGAFARRAFDNGKLDLTAVEGLADLIAAETEAQRRVAAREADGSTHAWAMGLRDRLVDVAARLEAAIDFSDEDLPDDLLDTVRAGLSAIAGDIRTRLGSEQAARALRDGVSIAVLGPPNVGKSSLINRLVGSDLAIVSPRAGTTRDVVEARLDIGGIPARLADTAGLRASGDEIEMEGVRRARARGAVADVVIVVRAADEAAGAHDALDLPPDAIRLDVLNKIDLAGESTAAPHELGVSALTGAGMDTLVSALKDAVRGRMGDVSGVVVRQRQRQALGETVAALQRAGEAPSVDMAAEDVRAALAGLGRLVGTVDVEDVLDRLFAEFCIGK